MSCGGQDTTRTSAESGGVEDVLSFVSTGNALPVLHEIKHALVALLERGEETMIDLGAIPFAPGDERQLADVLGDGEVAAVVSVLGESQIYETKIPGVWRINNLDDNGELQSRFIEVTFTPELLKTQREDAEVGLGLLSDRLDALSGNRQT